MPLPAPWALATLSRAAACFVALGAAGGLAAQPIAATPPPGGDLRLFAELRGTLVEDTTSAWRYFPLALGNEWEYEFDRGHMLRQVTKDTTALGFRYFVIEQRSTLTPDVVSRSYLRYDTTTATVRELLTGSDGTAVEGPFYSPCPLDAPFESELLCDGVRHETGGGYDGALVFGDDGQAGVGLDTVRTAVKSFLNQAGFETSFAADIGIVLDRGEGSFRSLSYFRVGDETRGARQFGVQTEPPPAAAVSLRAWPNPTVGPLTVVFIPLRPIADPAAELFVSDALGRIVVQRRVSLDQTQLDLSALAPNVYVVTVRIAGASSSSIRVTVLR